MEQQKTPGIDDMAEKIRILAEMMKLSGESQDSDNLDMMLGRFVKSYDAATKIKDILFRPTESQGDSQTRLITGGNLDSDYLSAMDSNSAFKSIKAALPFLEPEHRRSLGIIVKFIEIQRLFEVYGGAIASMREKSGNDWDKAMLSLMYPYVSEPNQKILDMVIKVIDLKTVLDSYK